MIKEECYRKIIDFRVVFWFLILFCFLVLYFVVCWSPDLCLFTVYTLIHIFGFVYQFSLIKCWNFICIRISLHFMTAIGGGAAHPHLFILKLILELTINLWEKYKQSHSFKWSHWDNLLTPCRNMRQREIAKKLIQTIHRVCVHVNVYVPYLSVGVYLDSQRRTDFLILLMAHRALNVCCLDISCVQLFCLMDWLCIKVLYWDRRGRQTGFSTDWSLGFESVLVSLC